LTRFLEKEPVVAFVENTSKANGDLFTRDGEPILPGSIFRWWYPLSSSYELSGVKVINPNCVWVAVRDKLKSYATLSRAKAFRVPRSFAVSNSAQARELISRCTTTFSDGFVLKPRTGYGGHGVQVGALGDTVKEFTGKYMLSQRIIAAPWYDQFWDVRVFVMAGQYLGGLVRTSRDPVTNLFQGGQARPLADGLAALLEPAALEAVQMLDRAATVILGQPESLACSLTRVSW
jgi:glutathione synthase/RimK-type ligase-like ATP-grasp enzyme